MSFDPAPERGPETSGERLTYAAIALFVLFAFGAEMLSSFEPAKLSILFVLAFTAPLLVLHELSHMVVARSVGWRVERIVLGFGPRLAETTWWGVPVALHAIPVEGFVQCRPRTLEGVRARNAAVYAAGPGIELVLAAGILLSYGSGLLSPSSRIEVIALQSLALAAALGGVLNLIPHSRLGPDGEIPNDGLGIFMSFAVPIEHFERMIEDAPERS